MTEVLTTPHAQLVLDGGSLRLRDVVATARPSAPQPPPRIVLSEDAERRMRASVALRDQLLAANVPVYGVTTGFGDSVTRQIAPDRAAALQRNLVLYHLNGVGPDAADEVVRATQLIRANCLARGLSAIRPEVVDLLLAQLAAGIAPLVPERGSLGASGDLVPLCYVAAALLGEGEVRHRGEPRPAAAALADEGLTAAVLEPKEGLALINGTSFTTAFAVLAAWDAQEIAHAADLATAMAGQALLGNGSHFHPALHAAKPHPGQLGSAAVVRELLAGSALSTSYDEILVRHSPLGGRSHQLLGERIQDKYSIRCAPHVVGVLRDTLSWVREWLTVEVNSATDNPLFVPGDEDGGGEVHHGGNFYAGHVGQAMDALKPALASIADLMDRQLALVVDEKFNNGLTPNLIAHSAALDEAGLHHGFKGMQIAASAVTAEALKTASAATVFSRSTEAHNQDKVSMGTIAARDARTIAELTGQVTAIHLIALAQALDLRGIDSVSPAVRRAHALIRRHVPFLTGDRRMDRDITAVAGLIRSGALRRATGVADPLFTDSDDLGNGDPRAALA
ncbi:HAL/PAL/TAL family ammonia-lyase [Actinacidiphila yeochonensis]|uniref:HAL/PAL/TAL family ammonia-lyase n=1 Tax=Actinacidiphila yeochonensis TaxID=89050 RepID=UPI00068CC53C|nr:aromatic amino acid ammonia-lyase [Actinacidiphila yeochonensis]